MVVLSALWAVPSKVSYLSALEARVQGVPGSSSVPLKVVLGAIALVAVVVPLSAEVVTMVVSLSAIVSLPSGRCSVLINVHGNWGVVHPSGSVR